MCDGITYPFPNFKSYTVEVWECIGEQDQKYRNRFLLQENLKYASIGSDNDLMLIRRQAIIQWNLSMTTT